MTIIIDEAEGITHASWTTAGRPDDPVASQQGFNTTLGVSEIYNGVTWTSMSHTFSATGGTVTTGGGYTIHTFLSSSTFTPAFSGDVEYLVVGGGGAGGGSYRGGGGGAGGFTTGTVAVSATALAVTIGAGGAGVAYQAGNAGNSSGFGSITASGGGGGGKYNTVAPLGSFGGSGGGTGGESSSAGAKSGAYGNDGGNGENSAGQVGGGGGGASAVGKNGNDSTAGLRGDGGAGTSSSISGSSVTYAGGGGGGNYGSGNASVGGAGGGAAGGAGNSPYVNGPAATANTGGGGGGASGTDGAYGIGGTGGSGIVIIRYLTSKEINQETTPLKQIMIVHHQLPLATHGGNSLAGVNIRDLNTVQFSNLVGASLASKRVTLTAGTYHMRGWAGLYRANNHKAYIYDVTNTKLAIAGSSEHSWETDATTSSSMINGVITTTGTTVFELRHAITSAVSTTALGTNRNFEAAGAEVYAELEITRIA